MPKAKKDVAKAPTCSDEPGGCEISALFRVLGKSHMLDLLHYFVHAEGPKRFVEVQHALSLSPNTLTERLKELVEAGLVERTAYQEIPPRVDYAPTRKAHDLEPVFHALQAWAAKNTLTVDAVPKAEAKA